MPTITITSNVTTWLEIKKCGMC